MATHKSLSAATASRKTPTKPKAAAKRASATSPAALWKALKSPQSNAKVRIDALNALGWSIADDRDSYRTVLAIVADAQAKPMLRAAALAAAHSVTFDVQRFPALRPDYLRTLRALGDDKDLEIRQRALGMLMREKDAQTQQRLMDGLREPNKAILPPEKALQLLAYEVHGDAYALAREIAEKPPSAIARREALRLLAADTASTPIFERIVKDKGENSEIRRLSASALHQLAPNKLQSLARDITMDEGEDKELRASCLVALAQFGDKAKLQGDIALLDRVDKLRVDELAHAPGSVLGQAAQQFTGRYGKR